MKFTPLKVVLWNQIAIMQSLKNVLRSLDTLDLPRSQSTENFRDRRWLTARINNTVNFMKLEGESDEEIHTFGENEQEGST